MGTGPASGGGLPGVSLVATAGKGSASGNVPASDGATAGNDIDGAGGGGGAGAAQIGVDAFLHLASAWLRDALIRPTQQEGVTIPCKLRDLGYTASPELRQAIINRIPWVKETGYTLFCRTPTGSCRGTDPHFDACI